jgi:pimeloyl-ACP methyl ester carboxylesterase
LRFYGFQFYRLPLSRFLTVFPFRFITLTSLKTTPSSTLSYWYRPHTSRTRKPVVFIHGIGIGLWPYVNFLIEINKAHRSSDDGQIGIIAIELMPISSRVTGEMPDHTILCKDINSIIRDRHGWDEFVLVGHSYGTVIAANLLKSELGRSIKSLVLIDSVVFLLHLPDVAYNFTRRLPHKANEHQLYYFASTDIMVAHTLARHFFWMQNILWKEDLQDRNVTVVLSGKDLIVNTEAVGRYLSEDVPAYERFLTEDEAGAGESDSWKDVQWKGEGLDLVWLARCDHAQPFEKKQNYRRLVDIVRSYSADTV